MALSSSAIDPAFEEFLDDFLAECDEHLTLVRHALLSLEIYIDQPTIDRPLLDDLFRAFHSLKGLAGMVGVADVEQLAHQMESFLRALQQQQVGLRSDSLDALIEGTRALEQVLAARRTAAPPPPIDTVLARLEALTAPTATPAAPAKTASVTLSGEERARLLAAREQGQHVWRVLFVPTPQLAERNVNVNSVRSRLQTIGELVRAVPQVLPTGGIAFEFLLIAHDETGAFEHWQADGITVLPYDDMLPVPQDASPSPVAAAPPIAAAPAQVVRVELSRLDYLMRQVSDLVITRARLDDRLAQIERALPVAEWRAFQEINQLFERQLRELRKGVTRARLVPVGEAFTRMQFVVRDLARDLRKQVALELSGQDTEIDKFIVERMLDPLLHLVRNAVSHGLEASDERVAAGKPQVGTITLGAATAGDMVTLTIADDGRGIDRARVLARARALGVLEGDAQIDDARLLQVLCAPGFSTREQADRISGRGVGMDVVATTVRELGGTLALETTVGQGARFIIQLPLTLSIMDVLVVGVADQRFAVPLQLVREVMQLDAEHVVTLERNELVVYRGDALPLVRLAQRFRLAAMAQGRENVFVVGQGSAAVGIVVDRVLGKREIVVRALTDPLTQVRGIAGATELGDGRVVLILDVLALVEGTSDERH